jgi:hypothetical protein
VTSLGEQVNTYEVVVGKFEDQRLRGRKGVDGRIILKLFLNKMILWNGSICLRMGTGSRLF